MTQRNPKNRNALISTTALAAALAFSASAFAAEPVLVQDSGHDSEQPATDTWITTKVKTTLLATEGVAGTDINVSTANGVVTLAGVLDSQAAVNKAIEVTRTIEGVVDVDTRALTVR